MGEDGERCATTSWRRALHDGAAAREVVEQAARRAVGRVHRAEEAPRVGEQLAHRRGAQLREEGAAVDGAEVRDVPPVVEALCDDGEAGGLLEVEARLAHEVARREEVLEPLADVADARADLVDDAAEPLLVGEVGQRRRDPLGVGARPELALDLLADTVEEHLEALLEDHPPHLPRQQHLLVHERVRVVGLDAARAEAVELLQHEHEELPLGAEVVGAEMDEDVAAYEELAHVRVGEPRRRPQHRPEEPPEEAQALPRERAARRGRVLPQHALHPVGHVRVALGPPRARL